MKARRLFAGVAVQATAGLRRALADLQRELPGERIRWTRLDNLHLTVEFFGATDEEKIPELAAALAAAAGRAAAFDLRLGGLGTYGGARQPRVLWMGAEAEGLRALRERVAETLREAGWTPEAREFAPHLTLGRLDRLKDAERFREALRRAPARAPETQAVRELILYESSAGRYVPVGSWALGGR